MIEGYKKQHYWCTNCHIPLIKDVCLNCGNYGVKITTDIKPVFKEEYNYYKEAAKKSSINPNFFPKILYRNKSRLISDGSKGKTHYRIKILQNISKDKESLMQAGEYNIKLKEIQKSKRSKIKKYFLEDQTYFDKLIRGNLKYLEEIEEEAIDFIRKISKKYSKYYKITSFSGGKDSTVTVYLVKKAIGDIPVIFSDTGIEYPETINYVKKYGNDFGNLLFLESETDFMEVCEKLGPPSRTMRWCCFTNKGAPFSKFYAKLEYKHVLSFDGIRRDESTLRSDYPREMDNTKYEKQHSAYPILNWTTLEVWLYILWKNLPYNNLYNHGFSRIGCWACPNNWKFDWYLFSKVYPEMVKNWFALINNYKHQQIETMKKDEDFGTSKTAYDFSWVEDGAWKSRRVKYHNENNFSKLVSPCRKHDFDLYLKHDIKDNLIQFLKVFGKTFITKIPSGQNLVRIVNDDVVISYLENSNLLKFYISDEKKTKQLKKLIYRQINKSFNCIDCGACAGACPQGAISINPHFQINEDKCINCLICTGTKYLKMSCVALHYKEKRILISLKKN